MSYTLLKDIIDLAADFDRYRSDKGRYTDTVDGFKQWIADHYSGRAEAEEPDWEGKETGRSVESVISTGIVHLNRYGKTYSRSAMAGSDFSTQDDYIYLVNLRAFGAMTKTDLIRKNIHEKPAGMQIINRLIRQGWVRQKASETDKRSRVIEITAEGLNALEKQMNRIRQATRIVAGDLTPPEKMELVRLISKLERFHQPIYLQGIRPSELLDRVAQNYLPQ